MLPSNRASVLGPVRCVTRWHECGEWAEGAKPCLGLRRLAGLLQPAPGSWLEVQGLLVLLLCYLWVRGETTAVQPRALLQGLGCRLLVRTVIALLTCYA